MTQRVSHKPHDAPSLAQQRLLVNPHSWLAYKRLPDPPWKHKVSQTDLLHDSCVDWPFLAKTLVHVQVFGHTGDRTVKLHRVAGLLDAFWGLLSGLLRSAKYGVTVYW